MTPPRSAENRLRKLMCVHGPEIVPACYECVITVAKDSAAQEVAQTRAEEREACAKVIEEWPKDCTCAAVGFSVVILHGPGCGLPNPEGLAAAIRALREGTG